MASQFHLASGGIIDFNSSAVTLTHLSDDSGIVLNGSKKLYFEDSSNKDQYIASEGSSGGVTLIAAPTEIDLTSSLIDINGTTTINNNSGNLSTITVTQAHGSGTALSVSGTSTLAGLLTVSTGGAAITGNADITGNTTVTGRLSATTNGNTATATFTNNGSGNSLQVTGGATSLAATTFSGHTLVSGYNFTVYGANKSFTGSTNSELVALVLSNEDNSANTNGLVSLRFDLHDTSSSAVDSGKIAVKKENAFTSTSSTQDSNMVFSTSLNGTLTEYMTLGSDGNLNISKDIDSEFVALTLTNQSDSEDTNGLVSLRFDLEDSSGNAVDSGKIAVKKESAFTSTGTTQDSNMVFSTSLNGTLTEYMTLGSDGQLSLTRSGGNGLVVTGNSHMTGNLAVNGNTTMTGTLTMNNSSGNSFSITNTSNTGTALSLVASGGSQTALSCSGKLSIAGNTATTGRINLNSGSADVPSVTFRESAGGTEYVGFIGPSSVTTSHNYVLPSTFPTDTSKVLQSTTSGVLSWVSNAGGGSSNLAALTDVINESNDSDFNNSILISTNNKAPTLSNASGALDNIFIGNGSGGDSATTFAISNGDENIVIGNGSFGSALSATGNIVLGKTVGSAITTGLYNILIGNNTANALDTGNYNVVMGRNACGANTATTASNNVILGDLAGNLLQTGSKNVLIGKSAGAALTTTDDTVAIGASAAAATTVGQYNTAVGYESLKTNIDGDKNTSVGYHSLYTMEPSSDEGNNTAVGYNAGKQVTTGTNNTLLGSESGLTSAVVSSGTSQSSGGVTGGSGTAKIKLATTSSTTDDAYNNLTIEIAGVVTSGGTGTVTATISDYVGSSYLATLSSITLSGSTVSISTAANEKTYSIKSINLTTGSNNSFIGYGTGGLGTASNQTSLGYQAGCFAANQITLGNPSITALRCADSTIATLSDSRDKENVSDSTYGLSFINSLRPVQYTWNRRNIEAGDENSVLNGKTRVGFLAQELQSAMPNNENEVLDLVYDVNPERLEAKYGNLIPIMAKAIQDLSAANDALVARVTALENA